MFMPSLRSFLIFLLVTRIDRSGVFPRSSPVCPGENRELIKAVVRNGRICPGFLDSSSKIRAEQPFYPFSTPMPKTAISGAFRGCGDNARLTKTCPTPGGDVYTSQEFLFRTQSLRCPP